MSIPPMHAAMAAIPWGHTHDMYLDDATRTFR
jgi:hypothetical protein